jgi:hypothetical protein
MLIAGGYCRIHSQLIVNRLEDEAGLKADGARWRSSWRGDAGGRGEARMSSQPSNCTTRPRRKASFATNYTLPDALAQRQ